MSTVTLKCLLRDYLEIALFLFEKIHIYHKMNALSIYCCWNSWCNQQYISVLLSSLLYNSEVVGGGEGGENLLTTSRFISYLDSNLSYLE